MAPEKMGKLISYLVGYTYQLRCIDQDVAVLRFSSDIPSVYIYTYIYAYIYAYIYMHMHMHMYIHIHIYTYMCVYTYVYMCTV